MQHEYEHWHENIHKNKYEIKNNTYMDMNMNMKNE